MTKRKIAKQAEEQEAMVRCMVEFRVKRWRQAVRWDGSVVPDWLYDMFESHVREQVEYGYVGMRP